MTLTPCIHRRDVNADSCVCDSARVIHPGRVPLVVCAGCALANVPNQKFGDSSGWADGVAATQVRVSLNRTPKPFSRQHVVESLDRRGNWLSESVDHGEHQARVIFRSYRKKLEVEFVVHDRGRDPLDAPVVARFEFEKGGQFNMLTEHMPQRVEQADGWRFPETVDVSPA